MRPQEATDDRARRRARTVGGDDRPKGIPMSLCEYCNKPATTTHDSQGEDFPVCQDCLDAIRRDEYEAACLARVAPFDGD
jgi:hypothetical protein